MNLTDRITSELAGYGLACYPVAKRIVQIVREANRPWWRLYIVSIILAFVGGVSLDYAWNGAKLVAMNEKIAKWHDEYDAEHRSHHAAELKPMSKAAAQVMTRKREEERGQQ